MTNIASSTFTGTNGTELAALDANFVKLDTCDNAIVSNNRITAAALVAPPRYRHIATPPSADYTVACDLYVQETATTTNSAGPMARSVAGELTGYWTRWRNGTGVQLFRWNAGTATQLGSTYALSKTAGQTLRLTLKVEGNVVSVYKDADVTPIISVTDGTPITAAGYAGLLAASLTPNGVFIDNWTADTLAGTLPDTTAPTLTNPSTSAVGTTTATGNVTTDEANGILYFLVTANATETAATVKASGTTQAITTTGAKSVNITGLTASTTYYAHFVHTDAAANDSAVVSSSSFTTSALTSLTLPALKNNTGTVLASETGATAYVYATTGAHVVTKTGQTTDVSGVMTITDAALVAATQYRVVVVLASGAEGMDKVTAG